MVIVSSHEQFFCEKRCRSEKNEQWKNDLNHKEKSLLFVFFTKLTKLPKRSKKTSFSEHTNDFFKTIFFFTE